MQMVGSVSRVQGIAPGGKPLLGVTRDLPTEEIPPDLRNIGSRFILEIAHRTLTGDEDPAERLTALLEESYTVIRGE